MSSSGTSWLGVVALLAEAQLSGSPTCRLPSFSAATWACAPERGLCGQSHGPKACSAAAQPRQRGAVTQAF